MMAARNYTDFDLLSRLLALARPYWLHIVAIFLISLLSTPLALLTPLPLKIAIDSVIGSKRLPGFLAALLSADIALSKTTLLALAAVMLVAITLLSQLQVLALVDVLVFVDEDELIATQEPVSELIRFEPRETAGPLKKLAGLQANRLEVRLLICLVPAGEAATRNAHGQTVVGVNLQASEPSAYRADCVKA